MNVMDQNKVIYVNGSKTIYRDGDSIVKLFEPGCDTSIVLNEALNQARVEETGLNINKFKEVTKIDGRWAIVSQFIEGETLDKLMARHPEKYDEYLGLFVDLQMEIHSKRSPLLTKLKDKMNNKIMIADIDATTRYDLHTRLEGMPRHNKVCHGDYKPENVIVGNDGKYYITDWAHVTQGNASADIARTYLVFKLRGEDEAAEKYLDMFCLKSKTEKRYVQTWMPIVAASQSVKGKTEQRAFLMKWVDVVDYE